MSTGYGPPAPWVGPARHRRWLLHAAVAVGVAALLVLVLYAVGVIPGRFPAAPSGPVAFGTAQGLAKSAAADLAGGSWSVVYGSGVNGRTATTLPPLAGFGGSVGCSWQAVGVYATGNLTLPGFSGNATSGLSGAWLFLLRNASGGALVAAVLDGRASVVAAVGGSACSLALGLFAAVPSNVWDSPAVLAAAGAAGGWGFLAAYPGANVSMTLFGGETLFGLSTGSTWSVQFSACGPAALPGTFAPGFNVTLNATFGFLLGAGNASVACTGVPAIPLAAPNGGPAGLTPGVRVAPRGR